MPDPKTIEIDEIVTPDAPSSQKADSPKSARSKVRTGQREPEAPDDPFAGFQKSLGWKTRITLWITQKFLFLRSKSWGKWVIVPAALLAITLAIPAGLAFIIWMSIKSFIRSFRSPR
ncbi:hypothetical protein [Oceaniferula spumae]|uniref:hypothetical protein n=1 Tax=Oceaniferula spumae TaxID=2979115 RepID=UPI003F4F0008